jgi:glutamate racemase
LRHFDRPLVGAVIRRLDPERLPRQDIIYFADHKSFPYGGKGREQLLSIMRQSISLLETFDPSAIIIASNANKFHNQQRRLA